MYLNSSASKLYHLQVQCLLAHLSDITLYKVTVQDYVSSSIPYDEWHDRLGFQGTKYRIKLVIWSVYFSKNQIINLKIKEIFLMKSK